MAKRKTPQKSDRATKIQRLFEVSVQRKALEKEEDALKEWFKKDCAGVPTLYVEGDLTVETTVDTRVSVDAAAVREEHGDKYDKTSTFMKVVARENIKSAA